MVFLWNRWRDKTMGIDWLSCGFTSHSTQNRSFRRYSSTNLWLGMEKQNLTQQKHAFTNQKKCTTQKLKPGLVASYDIRPGNGEGLFWFQHFINLSLTYLLRHLPTFLQVPGPTWGLLSCETRPGFLQMSTIRLFPLVELSTHKNRWRVQLLQTTHITTHYQPTLAFCCIPFGHHHTTDTHSLFV